MRQLIDLDHGESLLAEADRGCRLTDGQAGELVGATRNDSRVRSSRRTTGQADRAGSGARSRFRCGSRAPGPSRLRPRVRRPGARPARRLRAALCEAPPPRVATAVWTPPPPGAPREPAAADLPAGWLTERRELVEDDQAGVRVARPQAVICDLLEVLDQHPADQRHVLRSRCGGQTRGTSRPRPAGTRRDRACAPTAAATARTRRIAGSATGRRCPIASCDATGRGAIVSNSVLSVDVDARRARPARCVSSRLIAQAVEGARLSAFDQRAHRQRHDRLRQVAVDLTFAAVIERADEPVADGARLARAQVVGPAVGVPGSQMRDGSGGAPQRRQVVCEPSAFGIHHQDRPIGDTSPRPSVGPAWWSCRPGRADDVT